MKCPNCFEEYKVTREGDTIISHSHVCRNNLRVIEGANQSAIDLAQKILDLCKSGECGGFSAVLEFKDGTYRTEGSSTASRTSTAGMLLDAAIQRLK